MTINQSVLYYPYNSDNGNIYDVKMAANVALQGGFGSGNVSPQNPIWPYRHKDLRHMRGVNAAGDKRSTLPIASLSNATFQSIGATPGATWDLNGVTFRAVSAIGEKRAASHIR